MIGLIWNKAKKRFSWLFVAAIAPCSLGLIYLDYYWRTHETNLSRFF